MLSPYALVSLAELNAHLNGAGTGQDAQLEMAINAATAALERRTDRHLVSRGQTSDLTEFHTIECQAHTSEIFLGEWPLISVTSVAEDSSWPRTYGINLQLATEYELLPQKGCIRRLGTGGPQWWAPGSRVVKVFYKAGYKDLAASAPIATAQAIPDDLKQACLFVAASIYKEADRQRWGISAVSDASGNVTRFLGYVTPAIAELIAPYRRIEFSRTWERDAA